MDVEGFEYTTLKGARRFFTNGVPPGAVYAEVNQLGEQKKDTAGGQQWDRMIRDPTISRSQSCRAVHIC